MSEQMMYGVQSLDELNINTPPSGGKHDNVEIVEISKEEVGDNKVATLTIKLKFEDGKNFTHRFFPVNRENIVKNIAKFGGKSADEVIKTESLKLAGAIIHVLSSFVPADNLVFGADSWDDYVSKMIEIAGTAYEGQKFRCKVVFGKNGYATFPRSAVSPFFQNMKDPDTITINPKYDKIVPPTPTKEMDLDAPASDEGVQIKEDDLEF